jgi:hypothetical protein
LESRKDIAVRPQQLQSVDGCALNLNEAQNYMGAVVCKAGEISALETATLVNTRENRMQCKMSCCRFQRSRECFDDGENQKPQKESKPCSVGFGNVVRERIFFNQDAPSSPIISDKTVILSESSPGKDGKSTLWRSRLRDKWKGEKWNGEKQVRSRLGIDRKTTRMQNIVNVY